MFWRKKKTIIQANTSSVRTAQTQPDIVSVHDPIALFNQKILIAVLSGVGLLLCWSLRENLLLAFGAILISILIACLTDFIQRRTKWRRRFCLALAVLFIVSTVSVFFWWMGGEIQAQGQRVMDEMPAAWASLRTQFSQTQLGQFVESRMGNLNGGNTDILTGLAGTTMTFAGSVTNLILVLFGGLFLATQPALYHAGFVKLFPKHRRDQAQDTLKHCSVALRYWLLGKLISMVIVAVFITLGLWTVGMPSPLVFGLLAGVGEFVPFIGSIVTMIPALLIAFILGGKTIWWVIAVYLGVQQIQSNILEPLITKQMVNIPGALTLFGIASFSVLFGINGLLFAAPLTVLLFTLVKKLYVRDTLNDTVILPGE